MKLVLLLILTVNFNVLQSSSSEMSPIITTKSGQIRGRLVRLAAARQDVYEFIGIPFAEPPIGDLRFKKPVSKEPWDEILEATKVPNSCIEVPSDGSSPYDKFLRSMLVPGTEQSEDCLFLNIWVPKAVLLGSKMAPVYVFIHGGSFISGSSMLNLYNGTIISGFDNIIFVSIQYRLGSFGFAYFGQNEDAPGNAGLWDQLEALKWVNENIASFGGNNTQVTIGGQSAGGSSVTFHLLSPYSRKYFQRAIVESGTALSPWAYRTPETAAVITDIIVNSAKCGNYSSIAGKVRCLQSIEATTLARLDTFPMSMGYGIGTVPVIDGDFLPEDPNHLLENGYFYRVPMLLGANKNEGSMDIISSPEAMALVKSGGKQLNFTQWNQLFKLLEIAFYAVTGLPQPNAGDEVIFNAVQLHYWPTKYHNGLPKGGEILEAVVQAVGDYSLTCPTYNWAKIASASDADFPIFAYHFAQLPSTTFLPTWMGAYHGLEMAYVFGEPFAPYARDFQYNYDHKLLSKVMMEYWGNFIKYGDPNIRDKHSGCNDPYSPPIGPSGCWLRKWPTFVGEHCPFQVAEMNVLKQVFHYGEAVSCAVKTRDCLFWSRLFTKLMELTSKRNKVCQRQ